MAGGKRKRPAPATQQKNQQPVVAQNETPS